MTDSSIERNDQTSGGTPSFLSPVGATSRNYSVAPDEDDVMDLSSPLTPTMGHHPPLHNNRNGGRGRSTSKSNYNYNSSRRDAAFDSNPNSPVRRNGSERFWESDYDAAYTSSNDDINRNDNSNIYDNENDDDLPTPLLGYNYHHDDDSDDDAEDPHHLNHHRHHFHHHARHRRHDHLNHHHHYHHHHLHPSNSPPKLNFLNYLNVITYVLNVFTSYFIGVLGLFGKMPKRSDIFLEYETLVTPADYAYYLWAPILVFEFFFATAQLFPKYRARPIIQQGTGLYFFWACIIQTVWTVFFAMRWFILSFVAVVLALLCLVFLLASQHYNCLCAPTIHRGGGGIMTVVGFLSAATGIPRQRRKSLLEYWLFRFPFYLHCGWLLVCTVVQFSMAFRYCFTHSTGAQLSADIVALGVLLPPGTFFLTGQSSGPDFVIPLVIVWAYISIAVELYNPSDTLEELYGHQAILAVRNASYVFAGLICLMLIPRIVVWIAQEFCTIDVVELIDEDDDDDEEDYMYNIGSTMNGVGNGGGGVSGSGTGSGSGSGLFHRFSDGIRGDDGDGSVDDNGEERVTGDAEGTASASRGGEEYVLEEDEDEEDRYEDTTEAEAIEDQ